MTILTLDAIRENPWHAVYRKLPANADIVLLEAAFRAIVYCRAAEFALMVAARRRLYMPTGWEPVPVDCDMHEESEARWVCADIRLQQLKEEFAIDGFNENPE